MLLRLFEVVERRAQERVGSPFQRRDDFFVVIEAGGVFHRDNDVLVSATTATPTQSRTSFSASLGTTKDARKIGKSLFPVHRKATISSSAASKV